ncbi:MAG TPA: hypothetical protein VNO43_15285, partial [Candidatus Eisenbacteria bacterium]|nr:hypothetical protein [Candidatus Eisenbacteria bacterium]
MLASETRMVGPSRRCRFRATRFPSRFGELGGAVAVLAVLIVYALSGWALENRPPASTSTEALQTHARFLASRDLEGRSVDSAGIQKARDYIAREFARYGLEPAGDNGTYLQSFETVVGVSHREPTRLTAGGQALQLGVEWIPLGLSASDKTEAELVFAGYGITAKEHGYDDYAGLDVRNKIVIVLQYEPPPKTESSPFRKAPRFSAHAGLRTKANNAREHGAAG